MPNDEKKIDLHALTVDPRIWMRLATPGKDGDVLKNVFEEKENPFLKNDKVAMEKVKKLASEGKLYLREEGRSRHFNKLDLDGENLKMGEQHEMKLANLNSDPVRGALMWVTSKYLSWIGLERASKWLEKRMERRKELGELDSRYKEEYKAMTSEQKKILKALRKHEKNLKKLEEIKHLAEESENELNQLREQDKPKTQGEMQTPLSNPTTSQPENTMQPTLTGDTPVLQTSPKEQEQKTNIVQQTVVQHEITGKKEDTPTKNEKKNQIIIEGVELTEETVKQFPPQVVEAFKLIQKLIIENEANQKQNSQQPTQQQENKTNQQDEPVANTTNQPTQETQQTQPTQETQQTQPTQETQQTQPTQQTEEAQNQVTDNEQIQETITTQNPPETEVPEQPEQETEGIEQHPQDNQVIEQPAQETQQAQPTQETQQTQPTQQTEEAQPTQQTEEAQNQVTDNEQIQEAITTQNPPETAEPEQPEQEAEGIEQHPQDNQVIEQPAEETGEITQDQEVPAQIQEEIAKTQDVITQEQIDHPQIEDRAEQTAEEIQTNAGNLDAEINAPLEAVKLEPEKIKIQERPMDEAQTTLQQRLAGEKEAYDSIEQWEDRVANTLFSNGNADIAKEYYETLKEQDMGAKFLTGVVCGILSDKQSSPEQKQQVMDALLNGKPLGNEHEELINNGVRAYNQANERMSGGDNAELGKMIGEAMEAMGMQAGQQTTMSTQTFMLGKTLGKAAQLANEQQIGLPITDDSMDIIRGAVVMAEISKKYLEARQQLGNDPKSMSKEARHTAVRDLLLGNSVEKMIQVDKRDGTEISKTQILMGRGLWTLDNLQNYAFMAPSRRNTPVEDIKAILENPNSTKACSVAFKMSNEIETATMNDFDTIAHAEMQERERAGLEDQPTMNPMGMTN